MSQKDWVQRRSAWSELCKFCSFQKKRAFRYPDCLPALTASEKSVSLPTMWQTLSRFTGWEMIAGAPFYSVKKPWSRELGTSGTKWSNTDFHAVSDSRTCFGSYGCFQVTAVIKACTWWQASSCRGHPTGFNSQANWQGFWKQVTACKRGEEKGRAGRVAVSYDKGLQLMVLRSGKHHDPAWLPSCSV